MKEIFHGSFIAMPIDKSPLYNWLRAQNPRKRFSHFTFYFLDNFDEEKLASFKASFLPNIDRFKNLALKPVEVGTIGIRGKTVALKIEDTPEIGAARKIIEELLPEHLPKNLAFLPHITIFKHEGSIRGLKIPELPAIPPYTPTSLGIFYRTDEGATALLSSYKL